MTTVAHGSTVWTTNVFKCMVPEACSWTEKNKLFKYKNNYVHCCDCNAVFMLTVLDQSTRIG